MALVSFLCFFILSHLVFLLSAEVCPPWFKCGNLGHIRFPFTNSSRPECGLCVVHGCEHPDAVTEIQLVKQGRKFPTGGVTQDNSVWVHDEMLLRKLNSSNCETLRHNLSLPPSSPLASFHIKYNITLFSCNRTLKINAPGYFKYTSCHDYDICYRLPGDNSTKFPSSLTRCSSCQLPLKVIPYNPIDPSSDPFSVLAADFLIEVKLSDECWTCYYNKGGQCRVDNKGKFYCAEVSEAKDSRTMKGKRALKLGLGLGLGIGSLIIMISLLILWQYKRKHASSDFQSRNTNSDPSSNSDLETGSFYFGVLVFSYSELEEATNNFDHNKELGDGGFGTVYHGKLRDGREVAVKRLYENNYRRVEQFMNEVKILTLLRHKNLVSLYGCTSRHSRELLLVYEYVPNGTIADHIHGDYAKPGSPPWSIRMKIAIETASALAYLHASDIVHRDVKTNNILLDNNYCVKVADFGLSRLFPNHVTHISTAPQGTPGYVDPEYHQCYQLTSKSDVYSFGVVLIELISSMPAVDITRHRHEINLANLAITKIQKSAFNELVDPTLGFESDNEVKRMTISVGELAFQCLQQDKEMRPSMDEVLQLLKRIESRNNDDPENLEETDFHDRGIENSVQPPPPPSPDCDEAGLLKNMKLPPPSPNTVTDKWDSKSTTANSSG